MIGDFERPVRRRAAQDRALERYLRTQVGPFSPYYGPRLASRPVRSVAELATLPATAIADIADPASVVLRPSAEAIASSGDRTLRRRLWWARTTRRVTAFNRNEIEPRYKPIHWHLLAGSPPFPLGYTATDVDRLAEIGSTTLELAGVDRTDVVLSLQPTSPSAAFWQLALGARRSGVSWTFLDAAATRPDQVAALVPNVLVAGAGDLLRLLTAGRAEGLSFAALHTLVVVGDPLDPFRRSRLAELGGSVARPAAVVSVWGPVAARALWAECRHGTDVHTWPSSEVLEVVDPATGEPLAPGADGEIVYSPLGWSGSVVLRVRTGIVGCLDDAPCVSCGRTSPRVRLAPDVPPFARVLDEHPEVEDWQAELRTVGGDEELIVFVSPRRRGHPGPLLRELDRQLSVTQFVVLDRGELAARLRANGGTRVVDHRHRDDEAT